MISKRLLLGLVILYWKGYWRLHQKFTVHDKHGNKQLVVECQNALYGTMVASVFHVDGCKISHVESKVLDNNMASVQLQEYIMVVVE